MFTCRSCMRRHIQGVLEEIAPHHFGQQGNSAPQYSRAAVPRRYTSAPALTNNHGDQIVWRPRTWGDEGKSDRRNEKDRNKPLGRQEWLQSRGARPSARSKAELPNEFAIRTELTYLGDPLKLAFHILSVLRKDKFEEAENLVRAASRQIKCTVSWNHLVDWQLSRGKVNGAIKTYNEMKKRGQAPDAVTYTILFTGLAEHAHYPHAVSKALTIYNSMFADNAPVKPNMTHTNAAIKVCARAQDMDALFGIAAKLPRKGSRAANNLTFTTILNALRQNALTGTPDGTSPAEHEAIREKAVSDARRIWDDIIDRWSKGDTLIDEELVCSMGRVLLFGKKDDLDDIFELVEQTMKIPRPVPRLGSPARDEIDPDLQGKVKEPAPRAISDVATTINEDEELNSIAQQDEFRVVNPPSRSKGLSPFARPGCNTLSLVLQALEDLKLKRFVAEYWDLFTKIHKVQPDRENYITYLRILRTFRASSETVAILLQMPRTMFEKKTFRIAMSACSRDKNNQSALPNAGKILDLMQESQSELDLPALHSYMETAVHGRLYHGEEKGKDEFSRGRQILGALQRLEQAFVGINAKLSIGEQPIGKAAKVQAKVYKEMALDLAREMIGAYDRLISRQMVPAEMHNSMMAGRSSLGAFVTKYHSGKPTTEGGEITKIQVTREPTRYKADVLGAV